MRKFADRQGAILSDDRKYRYVLWREVADRFSSREYGTVVFIGLNPSTANESEDDPTIRRCMGFAKSWGYRKLVMLNLFALRATSPRKLLVVGDPIGPENNEWLRAYAEAEMVVFAWGIMGDAFDRATVVQSWFPSAHVLGLTKYGHPRHPLYVKGDTLPMPYPMS